MEGGAKPENLKQAAPEEKDLTKELEEMLAEVREMNAYLERQLYKLELPERLWRQLCSYFSAQPNTKQD
ncbi:hypothetical protein HYH03_004452 [Edaphochlamys debaryana]|uniref:Uncharacterized protein n=1 Tax=Edaphochlamys debaryana TaxID=47281 RepID=A0A835Y7Z5_9CHLO|nr:hypothetical protein HYH03_004452 [Edaphochlamys debaryana]|eukprot:KAG2497716.1 hypothetical protein HYH03_004452 [Edaphochlamys debaryana]